MDYLFRAQDGHKFFEQKRQELTNDVDTLSKEELENSDDAIKLILYANHTIKNIELGEPYRIDEGEVKIDITNDRRFAAWLLKDIYPSPKYTMGRRIAIHIPFSCDSILFNIHPSTYTTVFPRANVSSNELVFYYDFISSVDKPEEVNKKIEDEIGLIQRWAGYLNNDIDLFNRSINTIIDSELKARRERLDRDEQLLRQLVVPEKKTEVYVGFVRPVKKLALKIIHEDIRAEIEPSLEMETYSEIIKLVNDLGINLERSSKRLRELDEEPLRDTFLMALNSVYEGMVTGEAFNKEGKTDIIIKYKDRNLYIAECKIWNDDRRFLEGVDQLLGYLTWRDSKTSYIVLSKNVSVTGVIKRTKELLEQHLNFIKKDEEITESCIRYIYRQKADSTKNCYVTLHIFDLGSKT